MSETDKKEPKSVTPPLNVFLHGPQTLEDKVMESSPMHVFTGKVTVPEEGGMNLYFDGVLFPKKGFPFSQATLANNIVKRQTMMLVMGLSNQSLMFAVGAAFAFMPFEKKVKAIDNFLEHYCRNADYILNSFYLQDRFMTPCAQQIRKFVGMFLIKIGVRPHIAQSTAMVFSTMIEYDDSYRYRIEDLASETNAFNLGLRPIREIKRLIAIADQREIHRGPTQKVNQKFKKFVNAVAFLLMYPKARKAFRWAIDSVDFKYLRLDVADRYHVLLKDDYDYMGKSFEQRKKIYEDLHTVDGELKLPRMVVYKQS